MKRILFLAVALVVAGAACHNPVAEATPPGGRCATVNLGGVSPSAVQVCADASGRLTAFYIPS